jgi:hypothetical protein
VIGEYYRQNISAEVLNEYTMMSRGVFRLHVSTTNSSIVSKCIPYNATAQQLHDILSILPLINSRGGLTVRRYGADSLIYAFGYTYRIEFDAPSTSHFASGPLSVSLSCYGSSCGCAETKVSISDPTGLSLCPQPANYSHVESGSCVIPPILTVTRLSTMSFLHTSGSGVIAVTAGVHRFLPNTNVAVVIRAGNVVVSADDMNWFSLAVTGTGYLNLAGTGWAGWDSSYLLFAPDWEDRRGLVSVLSKAPVFKMSCGDVMVSGGGRIFTSGPGAQLFWLRASWNGGVLGGLADIFVSQYISFAGELKSLRYGITLHINDSASAVWTGGNISLSNGAHVLVRGTFNVSNILKDVAIAIGEAHLLTSTTVTTLLNEEPGRNWQSYFDSTLIAELRPGYYLNPLCLDKCLLINELVVQGHGALIIDAHSTSLFLLPVNIVGSNFFSVGKSAQVNMGSGGVFGDNVVVDLSSGTTLELSGGQMLMEAKCTIQGAGELIVSAGTHYLAFSVDAHITISGGTLLWPESRGTQQTITFNGGLLIQGTGSLEVQPFSTTILVHKEVYIKDQSMIQFPLIGIAAQASPFDRADAPDSSPRGNLTSTGTMRWEGGTLRGKADFNSLHELFLDGNVKYIKSLAKLVNKGHCEWGNGNIVSSDNGDFQNLGTIQMKNSVGDFSSEALYKGTELPVDNGGDFFALEYHSWDTDNGALGYSEYLLLRTRFVSKVPDGWTFSSQQQ